MMNKQEQINLFIDRMRFFDDEGIRRILIDLDVPYEAAHDKSLCREDLINMAVDRTSFKKGQEVLLIIDNSTDEELLNSIEENHISQLIIEEIDYESRQAWFKGCEGWAWFDELQVI